jgi:hypothetical protein
MKAGPKPAFLKNQVAYYLLAPGNSGANGEWKYADNFETLTAESKNVLPRFEERRCKRRLPLRLAERKAAEHRHGYFCLRSVGFAARRKRGRASDPKEKTPHSTRRSH